MMMAELFTMYAGTEDDDANGAADSFCYRQELEAALEFAGIDGYTMTDAVGHWSGIREPSFRVEVIALELADAIAGHLRTAADRYRAATNQTEVWITRAPVAVEISGNDAPAKCAACNGILVPAEPICIECGRVNASSIEADPMAAQRRGL